MNSSNWKNILEPILKEVFFDTYLEIPSLVPSLYNVTSSKKAKETYLTIANGGEFPEFNGSIVYDDMNEGYKTEISNLRFAKGFQITKDLFTDDQYGIMKQTSSNLATLAKYTREKFGMDIFNDAFSALSLGADGQNLCASAHPSTVGGVPVQSNTGVLALTYDNFVTTRQLMKKFVDLNGKAIHIMPDTLLVGVNNEIKAKEIANSIYKPNQTTWTANVVKEEGLKVMVSEFIDGDAWFLIDSKIAKKALLFQNREPVSLLKDEAIDQLIYKLAATYRIGKGYSDWRFVYGQNA